MCVKLIGKKLTNPRSKSGETARQKRSWIYEARKNLFVGIAAHRFETSKNSLFYGRRPDLVIMTGQLKRLAGVGREKKLTYDVIVLYHAKPAKRCEELFV